MNSDRTDRTDGLSPSEAEAFDALDREVAPPTELDERIVRAAAAAGAVGPAARRAGRAEEPGAGRALAPGGWWTPVRGALAMAAGVLLLLIGTWAGRATATPEAPRASFALILYDGPEFEAYTEDNYPERFGDYNAWFAGLRAAGQFVAGEALDATARVLTPGEGGPVAEDRLPDAPDGTISGVLFIDADSYDEAARIASSIPHLRYGGRVAIRRVDPT